MVTRNLDPDAYANEVTGDDAGGNADQPPMDVDKSGRLAPPVDAADYVPPAGSNPFADDEAQRSAGKHVPAKPKDEPKADKADDVKAKDDEPKPAGGLTTRNTPTRAAGNRK